MKYIFPKNYNFKNKILGVIDYPTAIFNIVFLVFIWFIAKLFFKSMTVKIFFVILFYFPFLLFCIFGFNNENVLYILYYVLKFLFTPKLYIYK